MSLPRKFSVHQQLEEERQQQLRADSPGPTTGVGWTALRSSWRSNLSRIAASAQPFELSLSDGRFDDGTRKSCRFEASVDLRQVSEATSRAFGWERPAALHAVDEESGQPGRMLRGDEDLHLALAWHRSSTRRSELWLEEMHRLSERAHAELQDTDVELVPWARVLKERRERALRTGQPPAAIGGEVDEFVFH